MIVIIIVAFYIYRKYDYNYFSKGILEKGRTEFSRDSNVKYSKDRKQNGKRGKTMSKIAIFLANGFEEIEGLTVVDICRRCGLTIDMVSITEENR